MKKLVWSLVLLGVLALGVFAAGPYLAVKGIREGIASNNSEVLAKHIDFPLLRQNIKDQLNARAELERSSENNILSALMSGFKAKLVEGVVDSMVTPEGLSNLMAGKKSLSQSSQSPNGEQSAQERDVFRDARFTLDSHNTVSVWVPNDKGSEMRLILQRRGFVWKLTNLTLPKAQAAAVK